MHVHHVANVNVVSSNLIDITKVLATIDTGGKIQIVPFGVY